MPSVRDTICDSAQEMQTANCYDELCRQQSDSEMFESGHCQTAVTKDYKTPHYSKKHRG